MKDFLLVLFYQAVVAVNTAVILSGIIWLAKRKENQKKTPNPDSTPPPEKKPPTPPTAGSCAVKPKGTCFYTLEVREGPGNPVVATFSAKSEEELKKQIEKLKAEPITVYIPAEESVKRYEAMLKRLDEARSSAEKALKEQTERFEKLKAETATIFRTDTKSVCGNCKHFLTTDDEATVGECGLNDEIVFKDESRGCFEPKPSKSIVRPRRAEPQPQEE